MHEDLVSSLLSGDARISSFTLSPGPDDTLIARVTPAAAAQAETGGRMLRQWQMVFDRTYRADEAVQAPGFSGWVSSFSGEPMARAAMQVWLDDTVAQLRAVPHGRVLDIGCGVGLVVAALGPHATVYHAIDQSEEAVAALGAWLATQPGMGHVRLSQRAAHALDDLAEASLDLVVLNSVVQYFPGIAYLRQVLQQAARLLAPGGRIFLGDVRALGLLPVHAAAVAAARAPAGATVGGVRERMQAGLAQSREFAVDPALFGDLPGLSDIRFSLKPPAADPELAGYRFDAMLAFGGADPGPVPPVVTWGGDLAGLLTGEALLVQAIPNARVAADVALLRRLEAAPADLPFADLPGEPAAGEHPEAIVAAAHRHGYAAELRFTPGSAEGRFDALFRPAGAPQVAWPMSRTGTVANDPLGSEVAATLRRTLQQSIDRAIPGKVRVVVG